LRAAYDYFCDKLIVETQNYSENVTPRFTDFTTLCKFYAEGSSPFSYSPEEEKQELAEALKLKK